MKGLKFGYGIFETLFYNGEFEDFHAHILRLNNGLESVNMAPVDSKVIYEKAYELMKDSSHNAIRISVYHDDQPLITYEPRTSVDKTAYRICYSKIKRHSSNPLLYLKTSAHLDYYLEKLEISAGGLDEALHFNEDDYLTEGIYTNIFFVKNGTIYTPEINCGLLPGIYRSNVIKTLKKLGIPLKMGYYNREDLESADEVFLTNSLIKIMPVFELANLSYGPENCVTQRLKKEML